MITVDFSRFDLRPGSVVLDLGCGSGRHACEAARIDGVTAVGADLNLGDLAEARGRADFHRRLGQLAGNVRWLAGDATALPFDDRTFDLVICSEVMEHVPDDRRAAAELVRVLKPGGDLAVSVPRYLPERICWALSSDYYQANGGHVRIYRRGELIRLLESAGVRHTGRHFAHGLHAPYWWLKCLVGPNRDDMALVRAYHRLLVRDLMERPRLTRTLDRWLTPWVGKSLVVYFKKSGEGNPV
jgi:SAM-dependent methyltransferase